MQSGSLFAITGDLPEDHPDRELQKQHLYNLEMQALSAYSDELCLPGGIMSRLGWTGAKLEKLKKLRGEDDFANFIFQLIINDILQRIDEQLEYHQQEMVRLLEEIEIERKTLDELDEDSIAIEKALKGYREDGIIILDNPARAAIAAYENRHDIRLGTPAYSDLLDIKVDIDNLSDEARINLATKQVAYDHHSKSHQKLLALRDRACEQITVSELEITFDDLESMEQQREPSPELFEQLRSQQREAQFAHKPEGSLEGTDEMGDEFSFDFPPLANEFRQASEEAPAPSEAGVSFPSSKPKPALSQM